MRSPWDILSNEIIEEIQLPTYQHTGPLFGETCDTKAGKRHYNLNEKTCDILLVIFIMSDKSCIEDVIPFQVKSGDRCYYAN